MPSSLRFLHAFPTFAIGGSQVRFAQLANHFARHGEQPIEHLIVAMDGRYQCLSKLEPGVRHAEIEPPDGGPSMLGAIAACRRTLKHQAPDLLLTYNWGAMDWSLANLALGLPEVHFEDGFGPDEAAGQLRRRILTRRLVLRWRAMTVLPSKVLLRHAETLWHLPSDRMVYIPNGIDCTRFTAGKDRADAGRTDDAVVIGTVAALRKEKNLGRLIEAFAALETSGNARLVIVGDGPERQSLEALSTSLGLGDRVRFAGHHDRPETVIADFDIFALSSDTEQMPISVIEAMAAGLPVAAVDVGDVREMVAEVNRPHIVPAEANALSRTIALLIDDRDLRTRLGEANRIRAETAFDEGLMVQCYAALFREVMGQSPAAAPIYPIEGAP
ncbi:MAG: glycosyltransferase family 4 protein [Geminicoccaceae bacterium]